MLLLKSDLGKKIILFFIVLSSIGFFRLAIIPDQIREFLELGAIALVVFLVLFSALQGNRHIGQHQLFRIEILFFIMATFGSMFVAQYYHGQDLKTTLIAQRFMYFYALYFLLHFLDYKASDVENLMLAIGLAYIVFFVLQYAAYPIRIFDVRIDVDRGTLRIFLPGIGFMFFAFYKYLQEYLTKQQTKIGVLVILIFIIGGLLQGTRQVMASMTLLALAFIFFNKEVKSRTLIVLMAMMAGGAIVFAFSDLFLGLLESTGEELGQDTPNVRIRSMTFFMTDFMPAPIAYILGNGQDSTNSIYGQRIEVYRWARGYFQSDIGIIGDYSKFGILFVYAQLSIFVRIVLGKLTANIEFIRYLFISIALTMFSGRNLFGTSSGIVFAVLIIYIVERNLTSNDAQE